jgi:arsenate reductase
MKILHNPRCRKSREGLKILEDSGLQFEIIDYLNDPLSKEEIKDLLSKLGLEPIDLVRKNEAIWKENYKGKTLSADQIVSALAKHPKLIERPVVVVGNKAMVGRPPENILKILP